MLVIIRSAPDTPEGRRGLKMAGSMNADIVLIQNGAYFAQGDQLEEFHKTAYVLDDDMKLRGISGKSADKRIKNINYDALIDLMVQSDKVAGMF